VSNLTEVCLTNQCKVFGENIIIKHNQRQRTAYYQLEREGSFVGIVNHSNGKRFVKSFRINNFLIKRIEDAKNKQERTDPKNY
jgi:hypothetical protein